MHDHSGESDEAAAPLKAVGLVKQYGVLMTLALYIVGFAVSNLHLATIGVVSLDVLRIRYVTIGFLFLVFVSAIIVPVYGLIRLLKPHDEASADHTRGEILWYLFMSACLVVLLAGALSSVAGSGGQWMPSGVAPAEHARGLLGWGTKNVVPPVKFTLGLLLMVILMVTAIGFPLLLFSKEARSSLWSALQKGPRAWLRVVLSTVGKLLTIAGFLFLINLCGNLVTYVGTNAASQPSIQMYASPNGWNRFIIATLAFYGLIATFLFLGRWLVTAFPKRQRRSRPSSSSEIERVCAWIMLTMMAIIFIVPTYAMGVYPYLPQQIGGGKPIRVYVDPGDILMREQFSSQQIDTYLMDRTSAGSILLLVDRKTGRYAAVELPQSQIRSTSYGTHTIRPGQ